MHRNTVVLDHPVNHSDKFNSTQDCYPNYAKKELDITKEKLHDALAEIAELKAQLSELWWTLGSQPTDDRIRRK